MSQLRKIRYRLFAWQPHPALRPADEAIDVVIPIIAKDLAILPLCLEGVRRQVAHQVKQIYIVAPAQQDIVHFCEQQQLQFVDENSVFGFPPSELGLHIHASDGRTPDRSGWLFQQFVKLSGRIGQCRHYLCIDADHVLIRPHVFLTDSGDTVFYMSYEQHQPYYDNIQRLLPGMPLASLSFVDHKMLFDKEVLASLHSRLSQPSGKSWTDVIVDSYDRREISGFSEFELYGNFCDRKVLRPWLQKRLGYSQLADYDTLCRRWSSGRWSLTFPDYIQPKPLNDSAV